MRLNAGRLGAAMTGVMLGCATAALSPEGNKVVVVHSAPGAECENLGPVVGKGGGTFGGDWISNDQLSQYAINDAMNKAAQKGATHLQISPPQLGGGSGTTTTATETGIAFKCPPTGGVDAGAAPARAASGAQGQR